MFKFYTSLMSKVSMLNMLQYTGNIIWHSIESGKLDTW